MADTLKDFYEDVWSDHDWSSMMDNSPAPKYRRKITHQLIHENAGSIQTVADIGCGNGALLFELLKSNNQLKCSGFDISGQVIDQNKKRYNGINWGVLDLDNENIEENYDLIVCSEVLEHVLNWEEGLLKLIEHTDDLLVVTVPSGKIFPIDKKVGHLRHFNNQMIDNLIGNRSDLTYKVLYGGFPFHVLYKHAINFNAEKTYEQFAASEYGTAQKVISGVLNFLFKFNTLSKNPSNQLFLVVKKK